LTEEYIVYNGMMKKLSVWAGIRKAIEQMNANAAVA